MNHLRRLLILLILALGIYFRGDRIYTRPLWADEGITRDISRLAPWSPEFRVGIDGVVSAAPLDYALTWLWGQCGLDLGGHAIRFPAFVYGVSLLFLFWHLLHMTFPQQPESRIVGLAFLSLHIVLTFYSQEARPYSLWALLSGVQLWVLMTFLNNDSEPPSRSRLVLISAVNVLLVQTSSAAIFQVFFMSALALWVIRPQLRSSLSAILEAVGWFIILPLLSGSYWLLHSWGIHYPSIYWTGSLAGDIEHCVRVIYATIGGGFKWSNRILVLCLIAGGIWQRQNLRSLWRGEADQRRPFALALFAIGAFSCALIAMGDLRAHYLICQRQLIFVAPFAALAAAVIASHPDRRIRLGCMALSFIYMAINSYRFLLGDRL